jgi:hypothetical protein
MEPNTPAQEPTPTGQTAASDEMTDEQLDRVAGGIIATELDNGFQAEDGRRSSHPGGVNYSGGISTDL